MLELESPSVAVELSTSRLRKLPSKWKVKLGIGMAMARIIGVRCRISPPFLPRCRCRRAVRRELIRSGHS